MENTITEIIARRQFMPLYIWLDIGFLVLLARLLLYCKKYMTVLVCLFFGLVYMLVDYGIFHLLIQSPAAGRSPAHPHSLAVDHVLAIHCKNIMPLYCPHLASVSCCSFKRLTSRINSSIC